jgi:hypothetical protein
MSPYIWYIYRESYTATLEYNKYVHLRTKKIKDSVWKPWFLHKRNKLESKKSVQAGYLCNHLEFKSRYLANTWLRDVAKNATNQL